MRLSAFLVVACLALAADQAAAEIKFQSVSRKIQLNSQFAKVSETIKVKNTGSDAVGSLILCQPRRADAVLAYQQVGRWCLKRDEHGERWCVMLTFPGLVCILACRCPSRCRTRRRC